MAGGAGKPPPCPSARVRGPRWRLAAPPCRLSIADSCRAPRAARPEAANSRSSSPAHRIPETRCRGASSRRDGARRSPRPRGRARARRVGRRLPRPHGRERSSHSPEVPLHMHPRRPASARRPSAARRSELEHASWVQASSRSDRRELAPSLSPHGVCGKASPASTSEDRGRGRGSPRPYRLASRQRSRLSRQVRWRTRSPRIGLIRSRPPRGRLRQGSVRALLHSAMPERRRRGRRGRRAGCPSSFAPRRARRERAATSSAGTARR